MDMCCICNKVPRNIKFKGLCSLECQIKFATKKVGDCLIQQHPILYKNESYRGKKAQELTYEVFKKIPVDNDECVLSECGDTTCLEHEHLSLIKKSELAKLRAKKSEEQRKIRIARIRERKRLKMSYCRNCNKEISMLDRATYFCDKRCEENHDLIEKMVFCSYYLKDPTRKDEVITVLHEIIEKLRVTKTIKLSEEDITNI